MKLEYFQITSIGDRKVNQDYMAHFVTNDYGLFIVADGLGGHHAGEKASQYFCQGMLSCAKIYSAMIEQNPVEVFKEWIDEAIYQMKVLFGGDELAIGAHTTCAVLYLDEKRVITAHCGDSRIYRMTPTEILWRSRDHSIPQDLLDIGHITEDEVAQHPDQNQLTRSISVSNVHPVDVELYPAIKEDETFVLCSDGFWGNVKPIELLQLADLKCKKENLEKLARLSIYRARGASDNVTALAVRCQQAG